MGKYERKRTRRPTEEEELESAYTSIAGSSKNSKKPEKHNHTAAIIAVIAAVIAVCFCIVAGYIYFQNADMDGIILENVSVAGVDVGGMTQAAAIDAVRAATAHTYSNVPMVVKVLDSQAEIPVDYVGSLNVRAAVRAAYKFGNSGTQSKRQREQQIAMTTGYAVDLEPYLKLKESRIRKVLEDLGSDYSTTLTQSTYSITGTAPQQTLVVKLGIPEYGLDLNALYDQVVAAYSANTFQVEGVCGMIEPDTVDLDAILQQVYVAPTDAYYDPETNQVVDGIDGYGFDVDAAKEQLEKAEFGSTVEIKLQPVPPAVDSEDVNAMLFRDVLATYTAKSSSKKNRDVNLRLACEAVNGLVLNPGDVFSYNDTLGERTAEKGYRAAGAYVAGKTVATLGGGICQVSSSLYYCVLKSELQVVARKNHGFVSSYMPLGLDATVSWGSVDFRFKNNSNYPIRIEASASGGKTVVSIIGTELRDYTVDFKSEVVSKTGYDTVYKTMAADNAEGYEDGDVISTPYTGYEVNTYLIRYDANTKKEISRDFIANSVYNKRDKVICKIETPAVDSGGSTTPGGTGGNADEGSTGEDPGTGDTGSDPATDAAANNTVTDDPIA